MALSRDVGPDSWNDADPLQLSDRGLTSAKERSPLGLWTVMGFR
jgi:alpha-galactosidase